MLQGMGHDAILLHGVCNIEKVLHGIKPIWFHATIFFIKFDALQEKNYLATRCKFDSRMQCNILRCMRMKKLHRGATALVC